MLGYEQKCQYSATIIIMIIIMNNRCTYLGTLRLQLQSMQQWQRSVEGQLASMQPSEAPAPGPRPHTDVSFPDSGFPSTGEHQRGGVEPLEDSFLSSGTADSLETVRSLALQAPAGGATAGGGDSADCSLLEQYLSSVQQREREDEDSVMTGDRTQTSQPPSPGAVVQPDPQPTPQDGPEESNH